MWPLSEDLSELVTSSSKCWKTIPLKPLYVLHSHLGSENFSHTVVLPSQLENVLNGALVVMQFVVNHHHFPSYHSFTALIKKLYVIEAGPNAPEIGQALFASHDEMSE
jgi:hypothetical protein